MDHSEYQKEYLVSVGERPWDKYKDLTEQVIGAAFEVHNTLGFGFLENVYHNALLIELQARGIVAASEKQINVFYKDQLVGNYAPDIIVDGKIIVELKSVERLHIAHEVQLVNYLTATGIDVGLLINFGARKVEYRRKVRRLHPVDSVKEEREEEL